MTETTLAQLENGLEQPQVTSMPGLFIRFPSRLASSLLAVLVVLLPFNTYADNTALSLTYQQLATQLENSQLGIPVVIDSRVSKHHQRGDIYGIIDSPFRHLAESLLSPANWCDITPLHLNIKACTHQSIKYQCQLTFYSGRKHYKQPDDAFQLVYHYDIAAQSEHYFKIVLSAERGPLGTRDYQLVIEAIPVTSGKSFVHFYYAYQQGMLARMATQGYLRTLGRDKTGFTVTGKDEHGKAVYVDGLRGVIERNALRYYFAIKSFLDTDKLPMQQQFHTRLLTWFSLTERYPQQLHELSWQEYLDFKQRERRNQLQLQAGINRPCIIPG